MVKNKTKITVTKLRRIFQFGQNRICIPTKYTSSFLIPTKQEQTIDKRRSIYENKR